MLDNQKGQIEDVSPCGMLTENQRKYLVSTCQVRVDDRHLSEALETRASKSLSEDISFMI